MKKVIAYFFLFIGFCLVFRTAVLNKQERVDFSNYINTIEQTDTKFETIQQDMREWAGNYKLQNNKNLDYSDMPEWYKKMMRWFIDVAYNFQMLNAYAVGLIRYSVLGVSLFFNFIFA